MTPIDAVWWILVGALALAVLVAFIVVLVAIHDGRREGREGRR